MNDEATAMLQTREVFSGRDALTLLFEAAGRNGDIVTHRPGSGHAASSEHAATNGTETLASPAYNQMAGRQRAMSFGSRQDKNAPPPSAPIDPTITVTDAPEQRCHPDELCGYQDAVRAWSRFRFVRAGWFTAKEGVAYIDYYYSFLAPLTPIVIPDFSDPARHQKLLTQEPMLAITLLTVASRFMPLLGPGRQSRAHSIHERLWRYLLGMIERLIWAQEQFGGGFCGAGAPPDSDGGPFFRKGLRTLGTVESLMLLTEWHPRALHFPPGDDNDELVIPETLPVNLREGSSPNDPTMKPSAVGRRIDSCLEPCWRSDRMYVIAIDMSRYQIAKQLFYRCWMLLGNAMTLSFELGGMSFILFEAKRTISDSCSIR